MPYLSVVMPAYNEAGFLSESVVAVVTSLRSAAGGFEVIVVENGSTDSTWAEAVLLAEAYPEVSAVRLERPDYGAALREGLRLASGVRVVNFDVDLVNVEFLEAASAKMDAEGAAIVVGSKRSAGAADRRPLARRAATAVYTSILRAVFGMGVSDTHGVKLMNRFAVAELAEECRCTKDLFDTELVLRCERAGLVVSEVPVVTVESRPPRTRFSARVPRTLIGLAKLRVALWQPSRPALRPAPPMPGASL